MTSEKKNRLDLPWKAGTGTEAVIYDRTGHRRIHEPDGWDDRDFVDLNGPEDAAYIVRAVNSHEALVAMVRKLSEETRVQELYDESQSFLTSLEKPAV